MDRTSLACALRCMACQDWKRQHSCPVCRALSRNTGGTHDAWSYFEGCLTHLGTAPRCIGTLLREDPLNACGNSLIPTVATLLAELSPKKKARDWLPALTILYMAPGGHRPVANFDQAIAGPIVPDCPQDPTASTDASPRSTAG